MSAKNESKTLRGFESADGILRSAAILGGIWMAYKVVASLQSSAGNAQASIREFLDEQARARRARNKAEQDLAGTMREQNAKDTQRIRDDLQRDQVERERRKIPTTPRGIKGRWEGNVFIPFERGENP